MKVAVLGCRGNLGRELCGFGYVPLDIDITKGVDYLKGMLEPFDTVINCAAATNLDALEQDIETSFAVNFRGAVAVRDAFPGHLVHISTAYIFSADDDTAITEDCDEYCPLSNYAAAKLGAELYLQTTANTTIVRTTGLFGGHKRNDLVSRFVDGHTHGAPANLYSQYIHVHDLAASIQYLLLHQNAGTEIINIVYPEYLSRFQLLEKTAEYAKINTEITPTTWHRGNGADRPRHCRLDVGKALSLGLPIGTLEHGLKRITVNHISEL